MMHFRALVARLSPGAHSYRVRGGFLPWAVGVAGLCVLSLCVPDRAGAASGQAVELIRSAGMNGGLVAHVGCDDGTFTAALHVDDNFLVHGLAREGEQVRKARELTRSLGLGGGVSIGSWQGGRLPYASNPVNLVVVEEPDRISRQEMMRVLAPGGLPASGRRGSGYVSRNRGRRRWASGLTSCRTLGATQWSKIHGWDLLVTSSG